MDSGAANSIEKRRSPLLDAKVGRRCIYGKEVRDQTGHVPLLKAGAMGFHPGSGPHPGADQPSFRKVSKEPPRDGRLPTSNCYLENKSCTGPGIARVVGMNEKRPAAPSRSVVPRGRQHHQKPVSLDSKHHDRDLEMSASQPISCNGVPSPSSQWCCAAGYICTSYTGCVLPDDDSYILDQRPCAQLLDPRDADYVPPVASTSATAADISAPTGGIGLSPHSETFQIIFVYPAVVFAVLVAIMVLACEMRRRRRRDLRDWQTSRADILGTRLGAGSRRQDDPELPSYAEHWRMGVQLRVDVESGGVQPPKYPEAVLDVADPRAAGMAPRTPPPVYA